MQNHVTIDDLLRFRDGSADAGEALAIGRHLAGCDRCAALAREMFRDEALDLSTIPQSPALWPRLLAVAALVLVVVAAVLFFVLRRRVPNQPVPPPVASTGTAPSPERYDRAEWNALVRDALASGAVTLAAPAAAANDDVLRGAADGLDGTMTPAATAVESARPEFSWPAVRGAKFVVSIVAGDDVVARSETLDRNRWVPERPLARGRTYSWQVRVLRDAGVGTLPAPPRSNPRFRVITEDEARDLAAARGRYPQDHLLLGVLAAHHGLRDDARRELARYALEHPSPPAARLAASVARP